MTRAMGLLLGFVVVFLTACGVPNPPKVLLANLDGNTLPAAAEAALDHKWTHRGWSVAAVDPKVAACMPSGTIAKNVISADFDSDGMADIAILARTSKGIRLEVLMARTWGYDVYDVDGLGTDSATVGLGLEPRGKRFVDASTHGENNFSSDTLTAFGCGQKPASYLWSGFGYYKVTIE